MLLHLAFVEEFVLFCDRGQAEKEFKVEVEAIGRVRHKNLVRLLGYCAEGAHRYLSSINSESLIWFYLFACLNFPWMSYHLKICE